MLIDKIMGKKTKENVATKTLKKTFINPVNNSYTGSDYGINQSYTNLAASIVVKSLSNKKFPENKLEDLSLSKVLNPAALTRAGIMFTAGTIGYGIDKIGDNSIPAKIAKGIFVVPLTTASALLTPLAKIDQAPIAIYNAVTNPPAPPISSNTPNTVNTVSSSRKHEQAMWNNHSSESEFITDVKNNVLATQKKTSTEETNKEPESPRMTRK